LKAGGSPEEAQIMAEEASNTITSKNSPHKVPKIELDPMLCPLSEEYLTVEQEDIDSGIPADAEWLFNVLDHAGAEGVFKSEISLLHGGDETGFLHALHKYPHEVLGYQQWRHFGIELERKEGELAAEFFAR